MRRSAIVILCLACVACEAQQENTSAPVPTAADQPAPVLPNGAPFGRFAFRWLQNAVYDRPITEDNPLTEAEMNEHFSGYRCVMPSYAEWSPPFDINRDGMIDVEEYERAKALYTEFYGD